MDKATLLFIRERIKRYPNYMGILMDMTGYNMAQIRIQLSKLRPEKDTLAAMKAISRIMRIRNMQ